MRNNKITGIRKTISSLHRYLANTHWDRGQCSGLAREMDIDIGNENTFPILFCFFPHGSSENNNKNTEIVNLFSGFHHEDLLSSPEKHLNRNLLQFSTSNILNTSNRRKLICKFSTECQARQIVKISVLFKCRIHSTLS